MYGIVDYSTNSLVLNEAYKHKASLHSLLELIDYSVVLDYSAIHCEQVEDKLIISTVNLNISKVISFLQSCVTLAGIAIEFYDLKEIN